MNVKQWYTSCSFQMEELSLMEDAVHYLDVSGNLQCIKDAAANFQFMLKASLVYRFEIFVSTVDLMEISAPLGNLLVFYPIKANALFLKVVCAAIRELSLLPACISENQISVRLKLTNLPRSRATEVNMYRQLSLAGQGYICCTGVIVGKSQTSKYTQSTRYICSDPSCEGNEGNHFIRIHVPGALEFETIRKDFKCRFCGQILEEVISCRHLSDKVIAEIIPESCLQNHNHSRFKQQTITLIVRDELTLGLKIGLKYMFIGIVRRDSYSDKMITAIEVNNALEDFVSEYASIPRSIEVYFKYKRQFNFIKMLACFFGGEISPPGTYMKLKLSCLLSLAAQTVSNKQVQPIHILAVGRDTEMLHRLLQYAMQFTSRSVASSSGNHLVSKVVPDKYNNSNYFIEGGSLMLASHGVCYMGNLSKFKKQTLERLHSALSSGKVLIDIDSRFTKGLAVSLEQPLHATVWANIDKSYQKKLREDNLSTCTSEPCSIPKNLFQGFSIVMMTDGDEFSLCEEVDFHVSYQSLKMSMEDDQKDADFPVSFEDFEQYFKHIRRIQVKMSSEAEKLLHRYYLAVRKARNSDDGSAISSLTLSSLISLAESHARLRLKTEVEEEDALEVIQLYEESLTTRFGPSILSVPPLPHLPGGLLKDYLNNQENKSVLQRFKTRLQQFYGLHPGHEE
ncbi:minichromosome maintenance domain-containing protein 2-like isoform X5 [Crassostrea virginica]